MSWAYIELNGNDQNKTDSTTLDVGVDVTIAIGEIAVLYCAADNLSTTQGETNDHSVSDTDSNTWVKIKEWTRTAGAAKDGCTVSLWYSVLTSALVFPDIVTVTFSGTVTAKVGVLKSFSIGSGNTPSVTGADGNAGTSSTPTATVSSLASQEYLWLGALAGEGPNTDSFTQDTDYANNTSDGTTGGSNVTNVYARFGNRIFTGTTDTWGPTLGNSRDYAAVLGALHEDVPASGPPPPFKPRERTTVRM